MFQSSTVPNFVYNFRGYVNGLKNFLLHRQALIEERDFLHKQNHGIYAVG